MNKDKALEKIKKCLALGKSANEHEAAQAADAFRHDVLQRSQEPQNTEGSA